jgi:hypothetical protein
MIEPFEVGLLCLNYFRMTGSTAIIPDMKPSESSRR